MNLFIQQLIQIIPKCSKKTKHTIQCNPQKLKSTKLSNEQKKQRLSEVYPFFFQEFPDFFEITTTQKYKGEILLGPNYEFISQKFQKTLLSSIDSYPHEEKNDPDLIFSIFKPHYKTRHQLSKAMTQNKKNENIQEFLEFLREGQKKISQTCNN